MHCNLTVYQYPITTTDFRMIPEFLSVRQILRASGNPGYQTERIIWSNMQQLPNFAVLPSETALPEETDALFALPVFPTTATFAHRNDLRVHWNQLLAHFMPDLTVPNFDVWRSAEDIRKTIEDITKQFPYFNRSKGRLHFLTTSHDGGRADFLAFADPVFVHNGSVLTCTADLVKRHEYETMHNVERFKSWSSSKPIKIPYKPPYIFDPRRDVSISLSGNIMLAARALRDVTGPIIGPEYKHSSASTVSTLLQATGRRYFVFFAGKIRNTVRADLVKIFQDTPGSFVVQHKFRRREYESGLRNSIFCLCPRGWRGWSPRLMEAMFFGCIPVVLADDYWMPQGCFWDWTTLAVLVREADVRKTREILLNMSVAEVMQKQHDLLLLRHHFMYHMNLQSGDASDMAMLELWLKQVVCERQKR
ncbi:unnamed protein product [Vitrella brassicaformis CCMP3155]|uniref:Exostosin GT47 domain-containing protein n=1 Tax=Vitrella brassicaformis (strain CCMP3155) TaxID=1169540 RepID=A0A0G4EKD1_VITBC|nr:unnamed protein product [Vitrella brassicaformis CCMP3155]|eukprot:CEL97144.1 unnamed protein product [Vitrella brassicaformis CCMP3155]